MEHFIHLCQEHSPLVYFVLVLILFSGVGVALGVKSLLPLAKAFFTKTRVDVILPPQNGANGEPFTHGPHCKYPCELHPQVIAFVETMKKQQNLNMEMIVSIRLVQENNLAVITEITRQQVKMWTMLEDVPTKFGDIKGELGEIKGILHVLQQRGLK